MKKKKKNESLEKHIVIIIICTLAGLAITAIQIHVGINPIIAITLGIALSTSTGRTIQIKEEKTR